MRARLTIGRLGERGEGIAQTPEGLVFVPYALPGETVTADITGSRGVLAEINSPSPDRIAPFCSYFTRCGGCMVQILAPLPYAQWKRGLVEAALRRAGIKARVLELIDAHGEGRRRATFHARLAQGRVMTGFMQARAHEVVEIDACPLLAPAMKGALPAARALAQALARSGKPLDILITATETGLDADIRGHGPLDEIEIRQLVGVALSQDLARLSNHGEVLISPRTPLIAMGKAMVALPPGAFLQATRAGEEALALRVCLYAAGARHVADLFCGLGTFALRIAEEAKVDAFDSDAAALAALEKAAHFAGAHELSARQRDLFGRPLAPHELETYDVIIFDPPRAGAEAQTRALAAASIRRVISVSCNPKTFARDAAILCAGGYDIKDVLPIDQFRHSAHVEVVACFEKPARPRRKQRTLLG